MLTYSQNILVRYSAAILAVTLALLITANVDFVLERTPFFLFFVSVVLITRFFGRGPGIATVALSVVVADVFIITPNYSFIPNGVDVFRVLGFVLLALPVSLMISALQHRERLVRESEARLLTVFGNAPVAVVVHRWSDRKFVDVNAAFTNLTGWTRDDVIGHQTAEFDLVAGDVAADLGLELSAHHALIDREVEIKTRSGESRSVIMGTVFADIQGEKHTITTFVDITERKMAEAVSARMTRLHAALSQVNQAIVWSRGRDELFTKICQVLVEFGGFRMVWIGLIDPDVNQVRQVSRWGEGMDTLSDATIDMDSGPESQRPILTAIREDRTYICNDLANDPHTGLWLETATSAGCRALAVLPIRLGTIVHGAIKVYADEVGVFQDMEVALLEEAAMDVSFALDNFERDMSRAAAEEAMRASETLYRTLFDYSPDGILIADPESYYLDANETVCKMLGYSREEFIGLHATDIVVPEEIPRIDDALDVIKSDADYYREWHFRRKDGSVFPGEVMATQMPDGNLLAVLRDISKRKEDDAMRESLAAIVESSDDAIISKDLNSIVSTWNAAAVRIFGYTKKEMIGELLFRLFPPDRREEEAAILEHIKLGKIVEHFETIRIRKDGQPIYISATISPIRDAYGKIIGASQIARDISESKRADELLRDSQLRLHSALEAGSIGTWTWDIVNDNLTGDEFIAQMFSVDPRSAATGLPASEFLEAVLEEDRQSVSDGLASAIESCGTYDLEYRVRQKDGEVRWVRAKARVEGDAEGNALSFHGAVIDITESKQAENKRRIISEIIQGIVTTPNLDEFLKLVHRSIEPIVYAENCFVMLHDAATGLNHFEFWVDKYDELPEPRPMGKGFSSYVLRTGKPLLLTDELKNELFTSGEAEQIGTSSPSWVGVPLHVPSGTIGVLVLQHYEDENAYSQSDLEFLASVGDQIALAIERKRAESALGDSEERYRLLFEKNPLPMWVYDLETLAFLEVNDSAVYHYGYSRNEFLSMTILDIRPSEDVYDVLKSIEGDLSDLQDGQAWRHVKKDGSVIDVELTSHAMSFLGHSARLVLAKDITETERAKEALSESEERNRDLVENALDIIYTHDLNGNYLSVNQVGEKITGYTREESLKMNIADTVAPEYLDLARKMVAEKLAGDDVTAYEVEIIAKDGHRVTVEVNTRIIYENGVPVRVQGIARDVTERKSLEEQFRQAQKMESIGVLAGGVAHDFNNLLTAINGYSDLTLRKMAADDPLRHHIQEIKDAGDRATALTAQLLAFSRKQLLKPTVHNLNSVITNIEKMLRRIIRESVEFRIILEPELGNIKADPGQIEQVIMNLAINSRDAMPDGGTLTIETQNVYLDDDYVSQHIDVTPGPFVKMTLTDTGEGMDVQVQKQIFDPFFTTKPVGKGTGLGLSTVYGIVKQSGGDIMVYSEAGHGTTFKIYLPCVDENVQKIKWTGDKKEKFSGSETILLVEDEEIVRNLIKEILVDNGYKVLEAGNGKDALAICKDYSEPIHLLLSDVIMPQMSGPELVEQAIKLRTDVKVLFMSGYTDDSISRHGFLDSGSSFIEKPFTPDGLSRKVREVLEY